MSDSDADAAMWPGSPYALTDTRLCPGCFSGLTGSHLLALRSGGLRSSSGSAARARTQHARTRGRAPAPHRRDPAGASGPSRRWSRRLRSRADADAGCAGSARRDRANGHRGSPHSPRPCRVTIVSRSGVLSIRVAIATVALARSPSATGRRPRRRSSGPSLPRGQSPPADAFVADTAVASPAFTVCTRRRRGSSRRHTRRTIHRGRRQRRWYLSSHGGLPRRRLTVPVLLLIVGVSLVGVAAIFFLVLAWNIADIRVRALIIGGITLATMVVASLAAAVVAHRDRRGHRRARGDPARPRQLGGPGERSLRHRRRGCRSSMPAWRRSPSVSCAVSGRSSRDCAARILPPPSPCLQGSGCSSPDSSRSSRAVPSPPVFIGTAVGGLAHALPAHGLRPIRQPTLCLNAPRWRRSAPPRWSGER